MNTATMIIKMKYIYKGRLSCLGPVEISPGFSSTPTTCIVSQRNSIEVEIKHQGVTRKKVQSRIS